VQLHVLRAGNGGEIDAAFATFAQLKPGVLRVGTDAFSLNGVSNLSHWRLATPWPLATKAVVAGGLMSYGPGLSEAYRQGGSYTVRILNGAEAGDLPLLQPTKFELVINLKTAKALGVRIPQALLLRADEVIE
jgi:putative ABC transport system substrate-binding protein